MSQKQNEDKGVFIPEGKSAEFCPTCREWYLDPENQEHIRQTTECLKCEHIRSDV